MKSAGKKMNQIKIQSSKTNHSVFLILLCFIFFITFKYILDKKLDIGGDNYDYINFANSILKGKGYSSPYDGNFIATNWYPPGYSFLLSICMLFVGTNVMFFKVLNGLFLLGSIILLYFSIFQITKSRAFSFSVGVLLLLNSGILNFAGMVMSEMPYLFVSALAFFSVVKFRDEDQNEFWKSKYFYLIVLSIVSAYYFRSIGITLLGAVLVYYLVQKKWRLSAGIFVGFVLLYLPWIIRNNIEGIKGRYFGAVMSVNPWRPEEGQISSIGEFIDKLLVNLYDTVIRGFTEVIFPYIKLDQLSKPFIIGIGIIVLLVCLFGAFRLKKFRHLFLFYILGNIFIFLIWHSGNGARYVWPLAPFIAYSFFNGVFELIKLVKKEVKSPFNNLLPYSPLLLVFFTISGIKELHNLAKLNYPAAYENYFKIAKLVGNLKNENLTVICRKPGMFYFYSNTIVSNYAYSLKEDEVIKDLIDKNADFVVLEQLGYSSTSRYLYPAIKKYPELFESQVHLENPDTYLLKFNKGKAVMKLKSLSME